MKSVSINRHCREINRCNQRGGRMFSIFDLLDAGSLDDDLAAYLMAKVSEGASFMVGAQPGGAGKTTVMCALLNLVPADVKLIAATPEAVRAPDSEEGRCCYVCHEIGSGHWFAYLWGNDLRRYCALQEKGHMLATNLHADDLSETRYQVCEENGVPEAHFQGFDLLIFLRVQGGLRPRRHWIELVYASDGASPHRKIFEHSKGFRADEIREDGTRQQACRAFIEELRQSDCRAIEDVRPMVLDLYASL